MKREVARERAEKMEPRKSIQRTASTAPGLCWPVCNTRQEEKAKLMG